MNTQKGLVLSGALIFFFGMVVSCGSDNSGTDPVPTSDGSNNGNSSGLYLTGPHNSHAQNCVALGSHHCYSHVQVDGSYRPIAYATPRASFAYGPAQVRHAYGFDQVSSNGAGKTVALVLAYHAKNITNDLGVFKSNYGITGCQFSQVDQNGGTNFGKYDPSWALEASLDVEWACAIAPGAKILLVEARDSGLSNMLAAVDYAAKHADVVSMSWGSSEFSSEVNSDAHFKVPNVAFFASSGDSGTGVSWPAISPYVIGVGGTSLQLNSSGNFASETAWSGSGGGISKYFSVPSYQSSRFTLNTNGKRSSPDVAYVADPNTGVYVYDSSYFSTGGWFVVGGTSAGSPQWAAAAAVADSARTAGNLSVTLLSSPLYSATVSTLYGLNYHDVISGTNGKCGLVCTAAVSYDFVTGIGSPLVTGLLPYLATH